MSTAAQDPPPAQEMGLVSLHRTLTPCTAQVALPEGAARGESAWARHAWLHCLVCTAAGSRQAYAVHSLGFITAMCVPAQPSVLDLGDAERRRRCSGRLAASRAGTSTASTCTPAGAAACSRAWVSKKCHADKLRQPQAAAAWPGLPDAAAGRRACLRSGAHWRPRAVCRRAVHAVRHSIHGGLAHDDPLPLTCTMPSSLQLCSRVAEQAAGPSTLEGHLTGCPRRPLWPAAPGSRRSPGSLCPPARSGRGAPAGQPYNWGRSSRCHHRPVKAALQRNKQSPAARSVHTQVHIASQSCMPRTQPGVGSLPSRAPLRGPPRPRTQPEMTRCAADSCTPRGGGRVAGRAGPLPPAAGRPGPRCLQPPQWPHRGSPLAGSQAGPPPSGAPACAAAPSGPAHI